MPALASTSSIFMPHRLALLLTLLFPLWALGEPKPEKNPPRGWRFTATPTRPQFPPGFSPEIRVTLTNTSHASADVWDAFDLLSILSLQIQRDGHNLPIPQEILFYEGSSPSCGYRRVAPGHSIDYVISPGLYVDCTVPGKYSVTVRRRLSLRGRDLPPALPPVLTATAEFEVAALAPTTQTCTRDGLTLTASFATNTYHPGNPLTLRTTLFSTGKKSFTVGPQFFNDFELTLYRDGRQLFPSRLEWITAMSRNPLPATTKRIFPGNHHPQSFDLTALYDCHTPGTYSVLVHHKDPDPARLSRDPLEVVLGFQVPAP